MKNIYLKDILVCPMLFFNTLEDVKNISDELAYIGEKCHKNGFNLLLHNHEHEFRKIDGKYVLDYFLNYIPGNYLSLELDVFWMQYANVEPGEYIKEHKDRCRLVHLKELKAMDDRSNTSLGKGIIDFESILKSIDNAEFIYEREDDGLYPWENITQSYEYFKQLASK